MPGIGDGFVVLGAHISRMSIGEIAAMIDLVNAFGAGKGVRFRAPSQLATWYAEQGAR